MRMLVITFLALALSGIGCAADVAPSPVAPAELPVFLPVVLPALKPDEQAALSKEMQTAGTSEALAAVVTKYAITVQGRGTKLPHLVAAAPAAVPAKPATAVVAELPGARPITPDEVNDFSAIIREALFKSGELDAFITAAQKERTLEGQVAVMNRYAAKLQARGVKLPHPVLANGSVPPLPGSSPVAQDPDGRVPKTIDPAWVVEKYDGDDNAIWVITKKVGRRTHRTHYDTAGFREHEEFFPNNPNVDPESTNPEDWLIERAWTQNQRLRSITINARRYDLPVVVHPAHVLYNAKQVIVWNDPKDQNKGIRSATLLPLTEPEGSTAYIGTWIAWNTDGREIERGPIEKGVRTGEWTERTFDAKAGVDPIAEASGTYINGTKSGTWTIKLSDAHPEAVKAAEEAQKQGKVSTGSINGFVIEQIYEAGKVVKETRSF